MLKLRVKTLLCVRVGKIRIPVEAFDNNFAEAQQYKKVPKCYSEYMKLARRRQPHVYNGNYASTTNSFSCGATSGYAVKILF